MPVSEVISATSAAKARRLTTAAHQREAAAAAREQASSVGVIIQEVRVEGDGEEANPDNDV